MDEEGETILFYSGKISFLTGICLLDFYTIYIFDQFFSYIYTIMFFRISIQLCMIKFFRISLYNYDQIMFD